MLDLTFVPILFDFRLELVHNVLFSLCGRLLRSIRLVFLSRRSSLKRVQVVPHMLASLRPRARYMPGSQSHYRKCGSMQGEPPGAESTQDNQWNTLYRWLSRSHKSDCTHKRSPILTESERIGLAA